MRWQVSRNCLLLLFEPDLIRGPHSWHCALYWNRSDDVLQQPLVEGELIYLDELSIRWTWPRKL